MLTLLFFSCFYSEAESLERLIELKSSIEKSKESIELKKTNLNEQYLNKNLLQALKELQDIRASCSEDVKEYNQIALSVKLDVLTNKNLNQKIDKEICR